MLMITLGLQYRKRKKSEVGANKTRSPWAWAAF